MAGRLAAAVVLFAALLQGSGTDALEAGRRAFVAGNLAEAEQHFRRHLKRHPQSAEALSNLAAVHARREQFQEAVDLYRKALRADTKLVPIHFNLAVSLGRVREYSEAAQHLRTFLHSYPKEPRAHQLLGLCLLESGDTPGALESLETSYKLNPADSSILYSLAYANARAGDEDRAAALLAQSELVPVQAKLIEGIVDYRRGRYIQAKALFEDVVKQSPDAAPAVAALGRLHLFENNDLEAIPLLERAVKLNPADAESTYQLGVLYDRNGRSEEGVALLRRALTLRAHYPDPHYQLGRIALREQRPKEALTELEEAKRILPEQESIRLLLGRTYQALGRDDEAKREFAEVRRLKRDVVERDSRRLESEALMRATEEP
jgi:Flp pilus assembly protein TadD